MIIDQRPQRLEIYAEATDHSEQGRFHGGEEVCDVGFARHFYESPDQAQAYINLGLVQYKQGPPPRGEFPVANGTPTKLLGDRETGNLGGPGKRDGI